MVPKRKRDGGATRATPKLSPDAQVASVQESLEQLQAEWTDLYRHRLPDRARERKRDRTKPAWPVSLDHCFARIILDNAVGIDTPWMQKVKAPATRNMTVAQLRAAIVMGEKVMSGTADLGELNQRSLELRGKRGKNARTARAAVTATGDSRAVASTRKEVDRLGTAKGALLVKRQRR